MDDIWRVDQWVEVDARTSPGINRPGGVGRITKVHYDNGYVISVDVKYVMGGGFDTQLDLAFVHPVENLERRSRSRRGREFYTASPAKRRDEHCTEPPTGAQETDVARNQSQDPPVQNRKAKSTTNGVAKGKTEPKRQRSVPTNEVLNKEEKAKNNRRRRSVAVKSKKEERIGNDKENNKGHKRRRSKQGKPAEIPKVLKVAPSCVSPLECPDLRGEDAPIYDSPSPFVRREPDRAKASRVTHARRILQSEVLKTFSAGLKRKPMKGTKMEIVDGVELAHDCTIDDSNAYKTPSPKREDELQHASQINSQSSVAAKVEAQKTQKDNSDAVKPSEQPKSKNRQGPMKTEASSRPPAKDPPIGKTDDIVDESRLQVFTRFLSRLFREHDDEVGQEILFSGLSSVEAGSSFSKEEARSCLKLLDSRGKIMVSDGVIYNV